MHYVTKSNGGIMPVAAARMQTAATLLSGPASGVIGAAYVAGRAGFLNIITLDVGGTSADMAVVEAGRQFKLLHVNDLGEQTLASPALVDGTWYWRTATSLRAIR